MLLNNYIREWLMKRNMICSGIGEQLFAKNLLKIPTQ